MNNWLNGNNNNGGMYGNNNGTMGFNMTLPHYEILKVNGREGAQAFRMAPNSSTFLADATNPNIIWLVQTDGGGYPSQTALDVTIHQDKPPVDINAFDVRLRELEAKYDQLLNSGLGKQSKKQRRANATDESANTAD